MTRSQAFACAKMASAPKKLRQTLLNRVFLKDDMNLKQCMYFLNEHLKICHFTLF